MSYVIAHRGASHFAPENTASAFRKAMELGADGVETDVQLTRDGEMVINHNYSIDGNSDGTGAIIEKTLAELREYDFGSYRGEEFRGERICTLDECLELVGGMKIINLELKAPMDRSIPYVPRVLEAVRAHGLLDRVILSAFDHSLLGEAKSLCPSLRVGLLTMAHAPGRRSQTGEALKALPQDIPVHLIRREDLSEGSASDALSGADVLAKDRTSALLEFSRALSALFPGKTVREIQDALLRQGDLLRYLRTLPFHPDFIHAEYHAVLEDPTLQPRLMEAGCGLNPWTPDRPEELRALFAAGCWGIITNRCDLAAQERTRASSD